MTGTVGVEELVGGWLPALEAVPELATVERFGRLAEGWPSGLQAAAAVQLVHTLRGRSFEVPSGATPASPLARYVVVYRAFDVCAFGAARQAAESALVGLEGDSFLLTVLAGCAVVLDGEEAAERLEVCADAGATWEELLVAARAWWCAAPSALVGERLAGVCELLESSAARRANPGVVPDRVEALLCYYRGYARSLVGDGAGARAGFLAGLGALARDREGAVGGGGELRALLLRALDAVRLAELPAWRDEPVAVPVPVVQPAASAPSRGESGRRASGELGAYRAGLAGLAVWWLVVRSGPWWVVAGTAVAGWVAADWAAGLARGRVRALGWQGPVACAWVAGVVAVGAGQVFWPALVGVSGVAGAASLAVQLLVSSTASASDAVEVEAADAG